MKYGVNQKLPMVYLARHGETSWCLTGQHTGITNLPLTERGRQNAHQRGERLVGLTFSGIFTSPLERASHTCSLAGFEMVATVDDNLVEWSYGTYEGLTTRQIHEQRPGWELFRNGCPGGESVSEASERAHRVLERIREIDGNVLLVSHGHFLRLLATRWLGLDPFAARGFVLGAAALSILGYNRDLNDPVMGLWNDCRHVLD